MAGTIVADLTVISLCDVLGDWSGSPTPVVNSDVQKQGSACLHSYQAAGGNRSADWTYASDQDFTDVNIFCWFAFSKTANIPVKGSTGLRIRVEDDLGNWGEWNIAGSDTLPHGGWIAHTVRTNQTFDQKSATSPVMTKIRKVGWRCDSVVGKTYIYFDAWRYGQGLIAKGGTVGDPCTFEDIYSADSNSTNCYGVMDKVFGVYNLQGTLKIGSTTGGEATYFKDLNKVIVFKDAPVGQGFYEILIQGNATAETKVFFGVKSGNRGISGCIFRAEATPKFKFTATDTNITELGVYGTIFYDADTISLPSYSTLKEVLSTNFEACAEILADTCIVKYCNFISADDRGVRIADLTNHHVTECNFISCNHGVHCNVAGEVTFDALKFSGNTYDIEFSVSGTLTVNCTNGSNPTTEDSPLGDVNIVNTVTLTVRHVKTGSEPTEYVRCYIEKKSDQTEIMNKNADVADEKFSSYYKAYISNYNYVGDVTVIVRAREKGYLPFETEATITSIGLDVTAVWIEDPNYEA